MFDEQNGLCYLCERPLPVNRGDIHVDHDHTHCPPLRSCGLCRRGLTCRTCNSGIGMLGDDPERLRRAADNLEKAQAIVQALLLTAPEQDSLF